MGPWISLCDMGKDAPPSPKISQDSVDERSGCWQRLKDGDKREQLIPISHSFVHNGVRSEWFC